MPGARNKIIIDGIEIKAALKVAEHLAEHIEEAGLLKAAEPFKERVKVLCYNFLGYNDDQGVRHPGLRDLNEEMAEFVDKHLVK